MNLILGPSLPPSLPNLWKIAGSESCSGKAANYINFTFIKYKSITPQFHSLKS